MAAKLTFKDGGGENNICMYALRGGGPKMYMCNRGGRGYTKYLTFFAT